MVEITFDEGDWRRAVALELGDGLLPSLTEEGEVHPNAGVDVAAQQRQLRLLAVRSAEARRFYEAEALRGGWTMRQLDRQIDTQFYERTALSRNTAAMLRHGQVRKPSDVVTPEEEIKDPYVLEFLGLKDEYSETDLEAALIAKLESFLLELGGDFTLVGRQRRLRVGDTWYRIDLLFFHRRLRCLVVIDLKLDRFTHADAGQMHLYLNHAREHGMVEGENPNHDAPIGHEQASHELTEPRGVLLHPCLKVQQCGPYVRRSGQRRGRRGCRFKLSQPSPSSLLLGRGCGQRLTACSCRYFRGRRRRPAQARR